MKSFKITSRKPAAEDGFTLIELLIVMSVMLILMTLAIPQVLKNDQNRQPDLGRAVSACDRFG